MKKILDKSFDNKFEIWRFCACENFHFINITCNLLINHHLVKLLSPVFPTSWHKRREAETWTDNFSWQKKNDRCHQVEHMMFSENDILSENYAKIAWLRWWHHYLFLWRAFTGPSFNFTLSLYIYQLGFLERRVQAPLSTNYVCTKNYFYGNRVIQTSFNLPNVILIVEGRGVSQIPCMV